MVWKSYVYNAEDKIDTDGLWLKSYGDGSSTKYLTRGGQLWNNMNARCSKPYQDKYPTYCGVTNMFSNYQSFMEWATQEFGYLHKEGKRFWQLDKDLLGCGKVYSEDTCLFVPNEVNTLMHDNTPNGLLKGVQVYHYDSSKFVTACRINNCTVYGGIFETQEEAHIRWKELKTVQVVKLISKYPDHKKMVGFLEKYLAEFNL